MDQRIDVLLIEDDKGSQLLLELQLREACASGLTFSIDSAQTLKAGLERLAEKQYGVVLLDLMLPDSEGLDTVRRCKQAARDAPIVVLTGLADDRVGLQAVRNGAHDFLIKERLEPLALYRALSYAQQRALTRRLEQIEAEIAERRRVEALKDRILSTVAHEIRSPLTVTKAAICNMCDGLAGALTQDQRQLVEVAHRNLDRLSRIIDNFLDLSRLESGKARVELSRVDVKPLLAQILEGARLSDRPGRLRYELEAPAGLPAVRTDPDMFVQVISNLVDNASRFAAAAVTVKARAEGTELTISVSDDGPGVPADKSGAIFERFSQLERSPAAGYKGTGLGLAICRQIARVTRSRVWLDPGGGPGATFHFATPVWSDSPQEVPDHVER